MKTWYEYKNEIPFNTVRSWGSDLSSLVKWEFTGRTGDPMEPYRHWAAPLPLEGIVLEMWTAMNFSFKEEGLILRPQRIIANMFNHGDSSWLHKDSENKNDWTAIIFLNDFWDLNWGGEMALVEGDDIIKSFVPQPGKFILFKSNIMHGARPVSREAPYPRLGVAFQCENSNL